MRINRCLWWLRKDTFLTPPSEIRWMFQYYFRFLYVLKLLVLGVYIYVCISVWVYERWLYLSHTVTNWRRRVYWHRLIFTDVSVTVRRVTIYSRERRREPRPIWVTDELVIWYYHRYNTIKDLYPKCFTRWSRRSENLPRESLGTWCHIVQVDRSLITTSSGRPWSEDRGRFSWSIHSLRENLGGLNQVGSRLMVVSCSQLYEPRLLRGYTSFSYERV